MKNMKNNYVEVNKYALILAGGNGTRLWPISTKNRPKQFLNLYEENIMINETIKRIEPLFEYKNIFVVINKNQEKIANRYIDFNIPRENIICEPIAKNTAMCIFYAILKIKNLNGNGIITILSSDHYIKQEEKLRDNIIEGIQIANYNENLVIVEIKPTYPATGFGYIKYNYDSKQNCNAVQEFREKPNYDKALEYLESGKYYWNSGIFIWNIETILNSFKTYLLEIYKYKEEIEKNVNTSKEDRIIKEIYNNIQPISIDKGILEKSNNIKMVKGEFDWMDIGSINDFFKIKVNDENNNVKIGQAIIQDTEETSIYNEDSNCLMVTIGIKNLNIVNCNGVILVANKEKMNQLPQIVDDIKENIKYKKYM